MSDYIYKRCLQLSISNIVDMGSGQGYLDHILVHQYGMHVVGVDCNHIQTCGAQKQHIKLSNLSDPRLNTNGSLQTLERRIEPHEGFMDIVNTLDTKKWMLCGLHTCGDLAVSCLKQFLESDCSSLVFVGCCYNLLTQFPLSKHFSACHLSQTEKMLACQAPTEWDPSQAVLNYRKHFYRALLQLVLKQETTMDLETAKVGKMPPDAFLNGFVDYATMALSKLNQSVDPSVLEQYLSYYDREKEIAVFWTLRSVMANTIESMILLDWKYFLEEQLPNAKVDLFPLFDQSISPRNMVISCSK
ncbi:methyltransferase domain-containing protein [Gorgonomyces haynaldii]|nr:methyltransferase domain-containing protein [Gorgonomyces haynaldii]